MKTHVASNQKNGADLQPQKPASQRSSALKHSAHRYERRKVREFLRHGADSEDDSARFERFG
jgi:hypothetical protein